MESSSPFFHVCFDNFLPLENFNKIESLYKSKQFDLKYTDLFKFLQTAELSGDARCLPFKIKLSNIFKRYVNIENTYYTIFASYYRKGDFLSCHDDMIDERIYAFTFYLNDLDSGDLILFNNDCTKEEKRISIKKNRLVIFEVSSISFHEVEICRHEGRKAITGWLNKSNHRLDFKEIPVTYFLPKNLEIVPFEIIEEDILVYEGMKYNFEYSYSKLKGPFVMRRVKTLLLDSYVVLDIPNYNLCYIDSYLIDNKSYILLNDFTNNYEGELLDIFIIESSMNQSGNIKLVSKTGELVHTLDVIKNVMYVVKRKSMKYFLERSSNCIYKLVHLIYKLIDN